MFIVNFVLFTVLVNVIFISMNKSFLEKFNLLYVPQGISFRHDDKKEEISITVKGFSTNYFQYQYATNAEPRFLQMSAENKPTIVFSKKVTKVAAKRIAENGNFYFDLQGNYEIKIGAKWIRHRTPDVAPSSNAPVSTYFRCTSEQASRILEIIARSPNLISARDIQSMAGTSLGLVGRIAHCLVENGYLSVSRNGYFSDKQQKTRLLNDWRREFQDTLKELPYINCISLFSLEEIIEQINEKKVSLLIGGDYVWDQDSHAHNLVLLSPTGDFQSVIKNLPILESEEKGDITIFQCPTLNCWSAQQNGVCNDLYGFLTGTKKAEDCLARLLYPEN